MKMWIWKLATRICVPTPSMRPITLSSAGLEDFLRTMAITTDVWSEYWLLVSLDDEDDNGQIKKYTINIKKQKEKKTRGR